MLAFSRSITQVGSPVGSAMNLIPEDGLPPILISTGVKGGESYNCLGEHISIFLNDFIVCCWCANCLLDTNTSRHARRRGSRFKGAVSLAWRIPWSSTRPGFFAGAEGLPLKGTLQSSKPLPLGHKETLGCTQEKLTLHAALLYLCLLPHY